MNLTQANPWTISFVFICIIFPFSFLLCSWCQSWYPINYCLPRSFTSTLYQNPFQLKHQKNPPNYVFFTKKCQHMHMIRMSHHMIRFFTTPLKFPPYPICLIPCPIRSSYMSNSRLQNLQFRYLVLLSISVQS